MPATSVIRLRVPGRARPKRHLPWHLPVGATLANCRGRGLSSRAPSTSFADRFMILNRFLPALAVLLLSVLSGCSKNAQPPRDMVASANPLGSTAAVEMLKEGGNGIDGAIAAQRVLGLVEPQSSGLGGGAFLLYWDGR